jgi:serine phosphatase RsbU (regulator of sigma subunit)
MDRPGRGQRVQLLKQASIQIASGIQNYIMQTVQQKQTLIDKELQLARQIQKTFLPEKLPQLPGYDLAAEWQTARQVGGDFYDVFELSPGRFGLAIADVSDKGLPASLYMTVSRTLIRAMALENESPARTLEKVNHILQLDSSDGFFVTVFYAILELNSGNVTYCVAGHNPPYLLLPGQGRVQPLSKGGIALGMMDPIILKDQELVLEPGDGIVLFTDGITETFSPEGEAFGEIRLQPKLESLLGETTRGIVEGIGQSLDGFRAGAALDDDYTLLVIRRE